MGGRQRGSARDADQLVALAIQGGLPTDTTQLDPHFVHRNISENTASEYERALELWEAFERRFPGSTPTNIQTLKQYAECIALAAKGRLDKTGKRRPTATSVRNGMRKFCSAWQRAHNVHIPPDARLSMAPYIEGELAKKLGLPTGKKAHKKKTFLTIENYVHMQERLWCNDYHHYIHEAYRLDNANLLNTHCFTSARLQEVCQARYQDLECLISWADGVPEFRLKFTREICKGTVTMQPVFPEWTRNGPTDKTRSPDSWSDEVSKWAKRAGLTNGTGLHAPRREALIKCNDRGYSLGQVLRFASQHNTHVLVNHYLGNMSTIDGAGTYLNMRPRTDLVEDFRSATMRWNPGLHLTLSAKDKEELEGSLEYKAVTRRINELSRRIREATTEDEKQQFKDQRRLEYDRRKAIENKRLREIQAAQKIIYDRGDDPHEQHDWRQIHFDRISHMLPPERLRLAKGMTLRAWPRSSEWVSVLKDLIALRENNDNAAYQQVMRPIKGYCAVPSCRKPMASIPPAERWQHTYDCHESYYKATSSFVKFCFHCSKWVAGQGEWKHHCQSHIESGDIPFRCDPIVFRHAVACAGYCPVHLGRQELPAHQRMTHYVDKYSWKRHLSDCLPAYIMGQGPSNFACPHMLCPAAFNSSDDLWHHLEDVHSVPKPKTSPFGKRKTPPQAEVTAAKKRITIVPQRSSVLGKPYGVGTAPSDNIALPRGQPLQVNSDGPATLLCSVSGNGYTECGFGYFEPLAEADADLLDFATSASPASAANRTTPTNSGADLQD
ncbi:hypothetical protein Purlil1_393 [Purpureocillium lilacinum]|uniref:C2H2-type domain-containing protein n=1 Tax=Purpureocillium lilacinum TaxID=33203 RepID=A0ABR0CH88_PURLI|nr:hypothetical protein Purlil1_393 [Purpureocillium lilacinum]